ncbi:MAG TPA: hypothetical protein EYG65_00740 [Rhodospirillales bacterium]|nr:hypothetical protein [Rhodospirillales bacterium]
MAENRPIQKNSSGVNEEITPLITSTGAPDASKIAQTDATGRWDISLLPPGIGADVTLVEAFEALAAGDFVNLFLDGGVTKARLADASDETTRADGFVLAGFIATATATVYRRGTNNAQAGLSPGVRYFLDATTPGNIVTTPPTVDGDYCQGVGIASTATEIDFERVNGTIIHP